MCVPDADHTMSFSCLPLKPGDHLVKDDGGVLTHALFCGQASLVAGDPVGDTGTVSDYSRPSSSSSTKQGQDTKQLQLPGEEDAFLQELCPELDPFVVFLKKVDSATVAVWKQTLREFCEDFRNSLPPSSRGKKEADGGGEDGKSSDGTAGIEAADTAAPHAAAEEKVEFDRDVDDANDRSKDATKKGQPTGSVAVQFYLNRAFTRKRSVYVALKALTDTPKIRLHPSMLKEVVESDVFPWHCLFQDQNPPPETKSGSKNSFDPGVALSQMKATRYRRTPYKEAFLSEKLLEGLQQGTVLISHGAVVVRGAKLARLLRFSSAAAGSWGKLGGLLGGKLSEKIYAGAQNSPRSAGAAAAGTWIGSVAGASLGASVATSSATTASYSAVASAHFGTAAYTLGAVEASSLATSIIAATSLGAAGAVVGAGAALLIKNKLLATEAGKADRTSQYLESELHLLDDSDNPFAHLDVVLGFDSVDGDDFSSCGVAVAAGSPLSEPGGGSAQVAHGWYTIPISPEEAEATSRRLGSQSPEIKNRD
eukprot:g15940.t1